MTLKLEVEDPTSPLRCFIDARLPHTKVVRALWRQAVTTSADVTPPAEITAETGESRRYPYDEVGHAASLRLTLLFSSEVPPPAAPPASHPLTDQPWPAAAAAHTELLGMLPSSAGFAPLPEAQERRLIQLAYLAGLFDQFFRIGPYPGLALLEAPPDATLDVLLNKLVHPSCVDDVLALADVARKSLQPLVAAGGSVVVGPVFAGSGDVGGADADLLVGRTLLEIKTRGKLELQQRHLHQVVAYALLDYGDEYGIDELAWYSARHGALVRLALSETLTALAGAPVDVAALRADLHKHLAQTPRTGRRTGYRAP